MWLGPFLDLWELRQLWYLPVSLLNARSHLKALVMSWCSTSCWLMHDAEAGNEMTARFFSIAGLRHSLLSSHTYRCLKTAEFFRLWSSIWYSKIWRWYRFYGCDEARIGDEVYRASGHGWSAGNLRADHCCHYQHRK